MKKTTLLLISFIILMGNVMAQNDIYYTRSATLQINGEFEGKRLFGKTQELGVALDYETTDIIIRFYLNTLNFNVDTLNNLLQSSLKEIVFKGSFSLDYINTEGHPPLDFTVEGLLQAGNTKRIVEGKGELHHINGEENFACMLGMKIYLNLKDYNIEIQNLEDEIEVIITQALLKKDKN